MNLEKTKLKKWRKKIGIVLDEYCFQLEPCGKFAYPLLSEVKNSIDQALEELGQEEK